jgi:hypothetical protein
MAEEVSAGLSVVSDKGRTAFGWMGVIDRRCEQRGLEW